MSSPLRFGGLTAEVTFKDVRNVHLSVHPPAGRVTVAAPLRMDLNTVRVFVVSKLDWIKRQQARLRGQEREPPREYLDRETHYVWGRRCLLVVYERDGPPAVELGHARLRLRVRFWTSFDRRRELVEAWYRCQVRRAVPALLAKWQPLIGVEARRIHVRRVRTRWGSCNPAAHAVRLNTDLAKKPPECLEHVLVHELVHLLEPTHNARFVALMDRFMPRWQCHRDALNRLPVRHEMWDH